MLVASVSLRVAAQEPAPTGREISNVPHAIVGRVTDPSGRPAAGVVVVALQRVPSRDGTRLTWVSRPVSATTNARGQFRLLSPYRGEHYVVAFPRNSPLTPADHASRSGYRVTYYPNAASAADAGTVAVGASATATADIVLRPAMLAGVSGIVIGSDRRPVQGGALLIAHGDGLFGLDSLAAAIRSDGTFVTPALPPGTYFLHYREGVWPPPLDAVPKVSGAKVTIAEADVANVRVTPIEMVRVTGRVTVAAARPELPYATIQVGATPASFEGNPGPQRAGTVRKDLTFEFRTWPSRAYVRALILSPGWAVKAVRLNGKDVTDRDVDFGHDVSGLEIEVVKRAVRQH